MRAMVVCVEVGRLGFVLGSTSEEPNILSIACGGVSLWLDISWRYFG